MYYNPPLKIPGLLRLVLIAFCFFIVAPISLWNGSILLIQWEFDKLHMPSLIPAVLATSCVAFSASMILVGVRYSLLALGFSFLFLVVPILLHPDFHLRRDAFDLLLFPVISGCCVYLEMRRKQYPIQTMLPEQ